MECFASGNFRLRVVIFPDSREAPMTSGLAVFTVFHVVLSLIGIVAGLVVLFGMISGKRLDLWTGLFLVTTVATSVTGFFFPFHGVTPGIVVGVLSLIVLALAIVGRYRRHLAGGWRKTYVITAVIALYFNVFVLIAQLFEKVPSLHALAPKGSEPPFLVTQVIVMVIFIALGIAAVKGFREQTPALRGQTVRAA
jgi:hypothetical protein